MFGLIWEAGKQNTADYFTKHYPPWHHKNEEHILAKSSIPCHATNHQIFPIRKQCERVGYSRNSRAFHTRTIPESYFTLNTVTKFHNCYVTVDIVSLLELQIPLHNSIPLCYCWHFIWDSSILLLIVSHNSIKLILLTSIQLSNSESIFNNTQPDLDPRINGDLW